MIHKGQTALEYLLIVFVALTVVIGVMMWLNAAGSTAEGQANESVDSISCRVYSCSSDADCQQFTSCGLCSECDKGVCKLKEIC